MDECKAHAEKVRLLSSAGTQKHSCRNTHPGHARPYGRALHQRRQKPTVCVQVAQHVLCSWGACLGQHHRHPTGLPGHRGRGRGACRPIARGVCVWVGSMSSVVGVAGCRWVRRVQVGQDAKDEQGHLETASARSGGFLLLRLAPPAGARERVGQDVACIAQGLVGGCAATLAHFSRHYSRHTLETLHPPPCPP